MSWVGTVNQRFETSTHGWIDRPWICLKKPNKSIICVKLTQADLSQFSLIDLFDFFDYFFFFAQIYLYVC